MALAQDGPLAGDLRDAGVEVIVRPLAVLRREHLHPRGIAALAAASTRDAAGLAALARRRGVGLMHSNTSAVLSGAPAAALARVPHVWHVREIYAGFGRAWPPYRRLLGAAAALPCVSAATAAPFGAHPRVRVLRDGLAVDAARAPRDAARRALGLPADPPVIAVLGRISEWKGQDVLVRALAEPALRDRGAIGLLAGAPWPGAPSGLIRCCPWPRGSESPTGSCCPASVTTSATVYGAADLVAVPSTRPDPLPGAALEAAAAGCAVLAAAHGGLPEIIRDGETGRLVAPGDPAALACAAAALLDDPAERARLGGAAATDVRARYGPERLHAGVDALYTELIERG